MITYVDFSVLESPAQVLVNTVNTVGVMGKGIAKDFKHIYPEMFARYQLLCERGQFTIGDLWLYKTPHKWILNFPTKRHWRQPSRPEYVKAGLQKFRATYHEAGITSVSFPLLGCGNGELDWRSQTKPLMEQYLKTLPIQVYIHLDPDRPGQPPEHQDVAATTRWLRSQPRTLAFSEVWEDLVALIMEHRTFTTSDGLETFGGKVFTEDDGGIEIDREGNTVRVHRDQLLELWQQVRDVGLCVPDILPGGLDRHSRYLLPVLAELPYLRWVRQADSDTGGGSADSALLLRTESEEAGTPAALQQLQLV